MKSELIAILEEFKYPVFLQGSLTKDEPYPPTFFTFWNNSSTDQAYYDNDPIESVWAFTVNLYSSDPSIVNTTLIDVRSLLKSNGWIVSGRGYDVPSDEPTHTGRAIDVLYIKREI